MGRPELYVAFDCVVISPKEGAAVRARPGLPRGEAQSVRRARRPPGATGHPIDGRSRDVTSETARLRKARYKRSAKGKAAASRYKRSAKGKAAQVRYELSEKGKAATKRYRSSSAGKAANAKARARRKERSADASRPDVLLPLAS